MAKKLGFALGSGGSRGVAHIGFLRAMEEANIVPDFISGCSMGSVVGSCYAKGYTTHFMEEIVKQLKFSDLFDLSLAPIQNGALLRSKKMQNKLGQYLEKTTFGELKIPFSCVATDVISGKLVTLSDEKAEVCPAVVASSSIPTIFRPLQMDDMLLVDGGVLCRVPVDAVKNMGAEVVVGVDVLGKIRRCDKKFNMFSLMWRTFDIVDSALTKISMREHKPDLFIEPELGDMNQYKFKDIDIAIEKGYEIGKANVHKIKQLIEE